MPTYDYLCTDCQHHWEEIQKITEPPVEVCPKCSHATARRQISGGNFILKGGGWYADLYGSTKPKTESKSGSEGASSSGESKSEPQKSESTTKPEPAKTETKSESATKPEPSKARSTSTD